MTKYIAPSIQETAFNCPHCGAFTTQYWHKVYAKQLANEKQIPETPHFPDDSFKSRVLKHKDLDEEAKKALVDWYDKILSGLVFFERSENANYLYDEVGNLFLSKCFNCQKIAVWVHDKLLFPSEKAGAQPNNDLPENVIRDFEEARSIVNLSPRGAAALLRLSIQKLCVFLGEKGNKLDDDIASLVSKGLNPIVQKSLDAVRVIGNEAVHPGTFDLKDDRDTALKLFDLINIVAEQMISHPKHVDDIYSKLPDSKRNAISARDAKTFNNK